MFSIRPKMFKFICLHEWRGRMKSVHRTLTQNTFYGEPVSGALINSLNVILFFQASTNRIIHSSFSYSFESNEIWVSSKRRKITHTTHGSIKLHGVWWWKSILFFGETINRINLIAMLVRARMSNGITNWHILHSICSAIPVAIACVSHTCIEHSNSIQFQ